MKERVGKKRNRKIGKNNTRGKGKKVFEEAK